MELTHKLYEGTSDRDVDYCLTTYGLVRFRDKIYVSNGSEIQNTIL